MRGLVVALVVCSLLAAGCTEKSPGKGTSSGPSSTRTAGTAGNGTAGPSGQAQANHAPSGTLVAKLGNGTKGLNATFLLTAQDADGDALDWTLSFGDNSTAKGTFAAAGAAANASAGASARASMAANATHHFAKGGLYNVTYTLTDGKNSTRYSLKLNVTGAAASVTIAPVTASWTLGVPNGHEYEFTNCESGPADGTSGRSFSLPEAAGGRKFVATITAAQGGAAVQGWGLFLSNAACGATKGTDYNTYTATAMAPISGTVLAGWVFGATYANGGEGLKVTITFP